MDEAHFLSELGDVEEALRAYAEASRLDPENGDADFFAARLLLLRTEDLQRAEEHAVRALLRNPRVLLDVEEDAPFRRLDGRPQFERAIRDARERVRDAS